MSYKSAALSGKIEELKAAGVAPRLVSWEKYRMIFGGRRGGGRRYAYFVNEQAKLAEERCRFLKLLKPTDRERIIFSSYRKKEEG